MNSGDRLARLLNALDGPPRGVRRGVMLILPLLLLAALIATFAIAPSGGSHRAPQRPAHEPQPPAPKLVPPSKSTPPPGSREPALSAATDPALRFLRGYLAYSYGRGSIDAIRDANPELIASLRRARARVPPAARKRLPRITTLQVLPQAPNTAQATATVDDGSGAQYALIFYLDRRARGWTVTRLGDD
ncbi:MAG: hypothetical protein ACRDPC_06045 [Solirubrobacteraceae bacterium]